MIFRKKRSKYMEENLNLRLRQVLPIMQTRTTTQTTYFGVQAVKSPIDFWVYQEIIYQTQPDFIVEIGNNRGGGTLALAHLCDLIGKGMIIGCDITHKELHSKVREHPRIKLIEGDACESFEAVRNLTGDNADTLIIEDSAHTYENTLAVLRTYSVLVKPGGYFIVEDGICHHGLSVGPNPGPFEAIEDFLAENDQFEADRSKESFLITWNPKGYLRRKFTS